MTLQHGPVNQIRGLEAMAVVYPPSNAPIAYVTVPFQLREWQAHELREQWNRAHEGLAVKPRLLVLHGGATITFAPAEDVTP